jgi:hypothetical protein
VGESSRRQNKPVGEGFVSEGLISAEEATIAEQLVDMPFDLTCRVTK